MNYKRDIMKTIKNLEFISENIIKQIQSTIKKHNRILILGIGDNKLSDDGVGSFISSYFYLKLKDKNMKYIEKDFQKVKFMDGKTFYTERMNEIIEFKPDLLIIIDTCNSKDPPGTVIWVDETKFNDVVPISSHLIPIHIFIGQLKNKISNLSTYLLGINPFSLEFSENIDFFMPNRFNLDDYENDLDIPFYSFNLSNQMKKIAEEIIIFFKDILEISNL